MLCVCEDIETISSLQEFASVKFNTKTITFGY